MVKVRFLPKGEVISFDNPVKLLVAARRAKTDIRFGCAACRCGTCGIKVQHLSGELSPMGEDEKNLLEKMELPLDGTIRLACQSRILSGEVDIDLDFQATYSPDDHLNP